MEKPILIGVDEVGRGCIAGDLVVCAYAIRPDLTQSDMSEISSVAMDSKAFSSRRRRENAAPLIMKCGVYSLVRRTPAQIEATNIRAATLDAMREASALLRTMLGATVPTKVVVDGRDVPPGIQGDVSALIKGDATVLEISCASVIAKVMRDREMVEAAEIYPGYGFEAHAGYGTRQHREAISTLGLCEIHRSWAKKFLTL